MGEWPSGARWAGSAFDARWAGSVSAAPGLLAFTGAIGTAEPHAHAAVQVLLVTEGNVELVDGSGRRQRQVEAAIIPTGVRHELLAGPGAHGLLAYLDPAGRAGRAAMARVRSGGGDPQAVGTWRGAAEPVVGEPFGAAMDDEVPGAGPGELPAVLVRALDLIPQLISGPLLLSELAARVGVSASRLGHLFAEHLQLPYPAWRRWARLLHAIEAVRDGAGLTEAAHAAGFADSAHLTRTCRAMFGITPSQAVAAAHWRSAGRGGR
ncbi:AraC family transcriptional regulator [Microbispora sp. NPDC088329]|uniref:AraC family transcriptional regulator n=1 Tax=Microbispora sp. NPDC088329 TaxID=3154869 RepID=UPI0034326D75